MFIRFREKKIVVENVNEKMLQKSRDGQKTVKERERERERENRRNYDRKLRGKVKYEITVKVEARESNGMIWRERTPPFKESRRPTRRGNTLPWLRQWNYGVTLLSPSRLRRRDRKL